MKKLLAGLGILAVSFLPYKGLSQIYPYNVKEEGKSSLEMFIGKDLGDLERKNFYSIVGFDGRFQMERVYCDVKGRIDNNFSPNSYSNIGVGVGLIDKSHLKIWPKVDLVVDAKEYTLKPELGTIKKDVHPGAGFRIDYKNISGDAVFGLSDKSSYFIRGSFDSRRGDVNLFTRGNEDIGNYTGLRLSTRTFGKSYLNLFLEYSRRTGGCFKESKNFFNAGLGFKFDPR